MNKRQKEVISASLDDEKAVLQALEKNYTTALADIKRNIKELQANPLTQSKAYQLEFQKQLEKQLTGIVDNLHGKNFASIADYLNTCYNQGFLGTMYDLQGQGVPLVLPIDQEQVLKAVQKTGDNIKLANKLGVSTNQLKKDVLSELQRGLATELTYADIARNISSRGSADMNRSMRIARTEGHRVQSEAKMDSLHAAKKKGADVVKQWDSTLDSSTRETHQELDGQIRELDESFTCSGGSAPYPGGFGDPAEDCNCRCCLLQRARWAVKDETSYQKWNNETGGMIECSGYADFKEKYLKAADTLQKAPKSGIINNPYNFKLIKGDHTIAQDLVSSNPNYGKGQEWSINCQRCCPTYEMRRRGFDVEALPYGKSTDAAYTGWQNIFQDAKWKSVGANRGLATKDNIIDIMKNYGDGARAEVYVQWKRGSAHVFMCENHNGIISFIDPQSGKQDVSGYFALIKPSKTLLCRLDELKPTDLIKECCK